MTAPPDWLGQARRLLDTFVESQHARAAEGSSAGTATGADCTWCPLCSAAAVVRGERPELSAALADALTAAATALRTFAESAPHPGSDVPAAPEDGAAREPSPAVQRIDIS